MDGSEKKSYVVNILDQKFVLKTENDEDHVKRVADYVNKIMHDIKNHTQTISTQNVAILGALNIAEQMFSRSDETKSMVANWRERLLSLIES